MKLTKAVFAASLTALAIGAAACDKKEEAKKDDKADAKKDEKKAEEEKKE